MSALLLSCLYSEIEASDTIYRKALAFKMGSTPTHVLLRPINWHKSQCENKNHIYSHLWKTVQQRHEIEVHELLCRDLGCTPKRLFNFTMSSSRNPDKATGSFAKRVLDGYKKRRIVTRPPSLYPLPRAQKEGRTKKKYRLSSWHWSSSLVVICLSHHAYW